MDTAFRYWQLIRLDSSGRCYGQVIARVKTWLQTTFANQINDPATTDRQLQAALLTICQAHQANADLALLSLRCYISHQIRTVCVQLASQFGDNYSFSAADLYPLVLDDDGRDSSDYRCLSLKILDSYDATKAQLNTWTTRLVKNHPEINQALLERGLYRISDWAILNDTTPDQVQRILQQYHRCSDAEITLAVHLLNRYQAVYSLDRLRSGKTGRCQPPTPEQLERMDPQRSPRVVLSLLKQLASQLRQYRIHARSGNPMPYGGDGLDWERYLHGQDESSPAGDDAQFAFLEAYQQALRQCLEGVLTEAIQTNMAKLQKRKPPKHQVYVQGLQLFHCEGLSMTKLAPQVGLSSQVQVNRLLQLKRLRADVRTLLIPQLQERVRAEALDFISADRLKQIDQTLEYLLTERVDQIVDDAAREAQMPQGRTAKSLFAHQLCQTIHQFIVGHE
jgi:hypothetical protein